MSDMKASLEQMIDKYGPQALLDDVAEICREKAARCDDTWQDKVWTRYWYLCSGMTQTLANRISTLLT